MDDIILENPSNFGVRVERSVGQMQGACSKLVRGVNCPEFSKAVFCAFNSLKRVRIKAARADTPGSRFGSSINRVGLPGASGFKGVAWVQFVTDGEFLITGDRGVAALWKEIVKQATKIETVQ